MRAHRFSFPTVRQFGFLALSLLTLSSCFPGTVWNVRQESLLDRVRRGDVGFLKGIDFDRVRPDEVTRLGPHAAFYMSFVFRDIGRDDASDKLLGVEWLRGSGAWRREAGGLLAERLLKSAQYERAEETAREVYLAYPGRGVYRVLLQSLYWQHKDADVLKALVRIAAMKNDDGSEPKDPELDLFRAVSSARLGLGGWKALFMKLFTSQEAWDAHVRAFDFLNLNPDDKAAFSPRELALMEAKSDIARERYADALQLLKPLIEARDPLLFTSADLHDLCRAYIQDGSLLSGIRTFKEIVAAVRAGSASGELMYAAYEDLGHLYRTDESFANAIDAYKRAYGYAASDRDRDRMLWYALDSEVLQSPSAAAGDLASYAEAWHTPSFFDDILDALCTELVEKDSWAGLWDAYRAIDGRASRRVLSRYAFVAACAMRAGFIAPGPDRPTETELLGRVVALDGNPYYTVLASARLGTVPSFLSGNGQDSSAAAEDTDRENLVLGFLSYGLDKEAYAYAERFFPALGPSTVRLLASRLSDDGYYIGAMRLMDRAFGLSTELTDGDLRLLYPQAFPDAVRSVTLREKIAQPIFYALVREESYFDPGVRSAAGAVGLSQLMPSTALDIARRMGIAKPDLTQPENNLAIGGHYFAGLLERFGNAEQALFAYNAGYRRVEDWRRDYAGLPDALFLEAIPFEETQDYGRKILVSAAVYGYLYYGLTPAQVVREIFPSF